MPLSESPRSTISGVEARGAVRRYRRSQIAVLEGDLKTVGPYIFRLKFPDGYRVPPHWHPVIEHVTVLKGTLGFTKGETYDTSAGGEYQPGSLIVIPTGQRHSA